MRQSVHRFKKSITTASRALALLALLIGFQNCSSGFESTGQLSTSSSSESANSSGTSAATNVPVSTAAAVATVAPVTTTTPVTTTPVVTAPVVTTPVVTAPVVTAPVTNSMTCDFAHLNISNYRTTVKSVSANTQCLAIDGGSLGGPAVSYACNGGTPVRPILQFDDCSYQLQALLNNNVYCLDAAAGTDAVLSAQTCNASAGSQRFLLQKNSDASYSFKTRDNRCVQMMGSANNDQRFLLKTCDSSNAQKFTLPGLADAIIAPAATPVVMATATPVFTTSSMTYDRLNGDMVTTAVGFTGTIAGSDTHWMHPQAGSYLEYTMSTDRAGNYSLQMVYGAWLPGTGVEVFINDQDVGFMNFPISGIDTRDYSTEYGVNQNIIETTAFPIVLKAGVNKIKLKTPAVIIPFRAQELYVAYVGVPLPAAGAVTPISSSATTVFDVRAINRLYRFTMDNTLGGIYAWRYPHNVAHLEYKINVASAGKYKVKINYSSPSGLDSIDVVLNSPMRNSSEAYTVMANVPFPTTGGTIGVFADSPEVILNLPAGESRLDFMGHGGSDNGGIVREFAIAGISLRPSP